MNILMITRVVDRGHSHAGHTYRWVQEIGRQLAPGKLSVLCLERGDISGLPENVFVHSLGKEKKKPRWMRWVRFPFAAWPLVRHADAVFCHQNPEYTIAVWPLAKLFRKRIVTWYVHGAVTWKTRAVARMADVILTASSESFRVASQKVSVIGHGIDTDAFHPSQRHPSREPFQIVSVGRISPTKDYETLIKAVAELKRAGRQVAVKIVGEPGLPEHVAYLESLNVLTNRLGLDDVVRFVGPVPNRDVAAYFQQADLTVYLSGTGSLDKAVLEPMACGVPVITSNTAFRGMLPDYLVVPGNDFRALRSSIERVMALSSVERAALGDQLREVVMQHHTLRGLAEKIIFACGPKSSVSP